jgi:hypothetical protein
VNFGKTGKRLDKVDNELAATGDLAVSINTALDRIEVDLRKTLYWISTADHVIVNLSENVQKSSNLSASRIETLGEDLESVNGKVDENIIRLGARIDALANETLAGAHIVNNNADESSADRARLVKLEARIASLEAVLDARVATINHNTVLLAEAAGLKLEPVVDVVTDLPRPPLAERTAARRTRRREAARRRVAA